ncbi:MAG: hypothetical protein WBA93_03110 [Microcoleaceae cyanobacterium]
MEDLNGINGPKKYEYDFPMIEMMAGELVEQYRGQNRGQGLNYRYVRHIPLPRHPPQVRCVRCVRCCSISTLLTEGNKTNASLSKKVLDNQNFHVVEPKNNIAQVHKTSVCDILERRLRMAEAKGDEKLLHLLEMEWEYMAC